MSNLALKTSTSKPKKNTTDISGTALILISWRRRFLVFRLLCYLKNVSINMAAPANERWFLLCVLCTSNYIKLYNNSTKKIYNNTTPLACSLHALLVVLRFGHVTAKHKLDIMSIKAIVPPPPTINSKIFSNSKYLKLIRSNYITEQKVLIIKLV